MSAGGPLDHFGSWGSRSKVWVAVRGELKLLHVARGGGGFGFLGVSRSRFLGFGVEGFVLSVGFRDVSG